jgi:hypothetical protein
MNGKRQAARVLGIHRATLARLFEEDGSTCDDAEVDVAPPSPAVRRKGIPH